MKINPYDIIVILGPTASGKTALATSLAYQLDGEIISADSRQVYQKLNLGTGKDYEDYLVNDRQIPFHLIDIADAGYKYNVYEYQRDFLKAYKQIRFKNKIPIVCGGSGLYIEAALRGYQLIHVPPDHALRNELQNKTIEELTQILRQYKTLHNHTDTDTHKRAVRAIEIAMYYDKHTEIKTDYPDIKYILFGILFEREKLRKRITDRLKQRLEQGLTGEVETLLKSGLTKESLIYYGLEYKYVTLYILGELSYDEMFTLLNIAIHQYSKRQMTWFRRMERNGMKINWIEGDYSSDKKINFIQTIYNSGI